MTYIKQINGHKLISVGYLLDGALQELFHITEGQGKTVIIEIDEFRELCRIYNLGIKNEKREQELPCSHF